MVLNDGVVIARRSVIRVVRAKGGRFDATAVNTNKRGLRRGVRCYRAPAPQPPCATEVPLRGPNRTRTATQLAEGVGYENLNAVNLQYGLLAARLGEAMEFADADLSLLVEFTEPHTHNNEHWILQMRPEVAAAIEKLGWV